MRKRTILRSSKRGRSRRRKDRREKRKFFAIFVISILIFITIGGFYILVRSFILKSEVFSLKTLSVSGVSDERKKEVADLIRCHLVDVYDSHTPNILFVDLGVICSRIKNDPRVLRVEARRHFPNELKIDIKDKSPIAIVVTKRNMYGVDSTGVLFPLDWSRPYDLPLITGVGDRDDSEGLLKRAVFLLSMIKSTDQGLFDSVSEFHITEKGDITCYLRDLRTSIFFGSKIREDVEERLKRLSVVINHIKDDPKSRTIDARFERIFIREA